MGTVDCDRCPISAPETEMTVILLSDDEWGYACTDTEACAVRQATETARCKAMSKTLNCGCCGDVDLTCELPGGHKGWHRGRLGYPPNEYEVKWKPRSADSPGAGE
jgi:hypothetical protein